MGSLWEAKNDRNGRHIMQGLFDAGTRAADMLEELGNGVEGSSSKSSSLAVLKGKSLHYVKICEVFL